MNDTSCVWIFDGGPNAPVLPRDELSLINGLAYGPTYVPTYVIAADSGLDHALALGFMPDVLVGDLDSVSPQNLQRYKAGASQTSTGQTSAGPNSTGPNSTGTVEHHPSDKDQSDLDLALNYAYRLNPGRVVVLSGGGGRLDHQLVGALCLVRWAEAGLDLTAYIAGALVRPVLQGDTWQPRLDQDLLLTLIAVGGPARVNTTGMRWNLTADYVLQPGSSRGLSNELGNELGNELSGDTKSQAEMQAEIEVVSGSVLAIVTEPNGY